MEATTITGGTVFFIIAFLAGALSGALAHALAKLIKPTGRFHAQFYAFTTLSSRYKPAPRLESFTLADPYRCPGTFRKAQLHLHTSESADVLDKQPVAETVRRYREAGYSFVVLTDHDKVTEFSALNGPDFVAVPGEEKTLPFIVWPLGKHLLRIGVKTSGAEGEGEDELRAPAHCCWRGNLGTGRWYLPDLLGHGDFQLFEIFNGKSHTSVDFWLWHKVLEERGYRDPVWGIAVDDTDNAQPMNLAWVMVKTAEVSRDALLAALRRGSFYASTGVSADFRVEDGAIKVEVGATLEAGTAPRITFLDSRNEAVAVQRGLRADYRPYGDEGFVRVEIVGQAGRVAWSQPFFLISS